MEINHEKKEATSSSIIIETDGEFSFDDATPWMVEAWSFPTRTLWSQFVAIVNRVLSYFKK
jgi:hypothetical protein